MGLGLEGLDEGSGLLGGGDGAFELGIFDLTEEGADLWALGDAHCQEVGSGEETGRAECLGGETG